MSSRQWRSSGLVAILLAGLAGGVSAQSFQVDSVRIGGDGGTDYLMADSATGRVFVSRATHVMVLDGNTGQVVGDIPNTPRVHGIALVHRANRGFTTNGGDSTVLVFDLKTLAPIDRIKVPAGGLDGIMYDPSSNRIVLTDHSRPKGTAVTIDPDRARIVAMGELEDDSPEGAATDGKGRIFVNNEGTSTIQVLDGTSLAAQASWPLAPCEGPTGLVYDRDHQRLFAGCSDTSVVLDAKSGKVVARIANGAGVDALGWDPAERLIYIPAGRAGNLTVAHQDDADHLHGGRHGDHLPRGQDRLRQHQDPRCLPVPAGVRPCSLTFAGKSTTGTRRAAASRAGGRGLVPDRAAQELGPKPAKITRGIPDEATGIPRVC
jgi:DNA-binding beta-propeller fold protein YncE